MATTNLSIETFETELSRDQGILIIDWWAPWCAPCRAFGPIYERASEAHPDITFGKVNTQDEPDLAGSFGIRSIPTLSIFRDGVLVFQRPGLLPEPILEDLIREVQGLDMAEVRAQVENAERSARVAHG